uniref:Uncharacterized protein n=1 Tax=Macrostomum lignano TaxID=282301 RepID=A0A1I8GSC4_9PLAT
MTNLRSTLRLTTRSHSSRWIAPRQTALLS